MAASQRRHRNVHDDRHCLECAHLDRRSHTHTRLAATLQRVLPPLRAKTWRPAAQKAVLARLDLRGSSHKQPGSDIFAFSFIGAGQFKRRYEFFSNFVHSGFGYVFCFVLFCLKKSL